MFDAALAQPFGHGLGRHRPALREDVQAAIRGVLGALGLPTTTRVLYGGSVKAANVGAIMAQAVAMTKTAMQATTNSGRLKPES